MVPLLGDGRQVIANNVFKGGTSRYPAERSNQTTIRVALIGNSIHVVHIIPRKIFLRVTFTLRKCVARSKKVDLLPL